MRQYAQNPEFYLMRARALVAMDQTTAISINRFKGEIEANTLKADAAHYGLALAYLKANQLNEARQAMAELLQAQPTNLIFLLHRYRNRYSAKKYSRALNRLNRELVVNQNNYPLMVLKSEPSGRRAIMMAQIRAHGPIANASSGSYDLVSPG